MRPRLYKSTLFTGYGWTDPDPTLGEAYLIRRGDVALVLRPSDFVDKSANLLMDESMCLFGQTVVWLDNVSLKNHFKRVRL